MNELINLIEQDHLGWYRENPSLKTLTTYRCGGNAKLLVFPKDVECLKTILKYLKNNNINYKIFGNGSNILASDKDFDGVIIKLTKICGIDKNDTNIVVDAGYSFSLLANQLSKEGLSGLEFACGIPGTVGGAIYMNAGAYLSDVSKILEKIDILDENLEEKTVYNKDLDFSYRHSILSEKDWIVLKAYFKLKKGDKETITELVTERKMRRIESQPLDYPSAGSVFRNPEGDFAGRLIEEVGLKGYMYGGASVSEKHANFIVNVKDAKSSDIKYLIDLAKEKVKEEFGVELRTEQELFNWE